MRQQAQARLKLSREHTEQLLKRAPAVYGTQINDLLLSALSRALCRWSQQPSALILLEGHGREDLFESIDLSRSLGWFTSMFPVRLRPDGDDIGQSIIDVQAQLAGVPQKGIGYGVLRHLAGPDISAQLAALPQARVTFNYLGQFDQSFDEQALLVPALEETGDNYSLKANLGNWLEIVGQVYDGQLALRCIYSSQRYRAGTMDALMSDYQRELESVDRTLHGACGLIARSLRGRCPSAPVLLRIQGFLTMSLHPDLEAFLDLAQDSQDAGLPAMHQLTPSEARATFEQTTAQLRWPAPQDLEVTEIETQARDGAALALRLYPAQRY